MTLERSTVTTWTRLDLGPRTGDVVEHHQLIIRWTNDGYTRIHEDALGPLLRAAGYELEKPRPITPHRIEGTRLVNEVGGCNCNGGDAASNGAHEPYCGLEPEVNLATLDGFGELIAEMAGCEHPSWTGTDQAPIDDPEKPWRCDVCRHLRIGDPSKAAALRSAPLANDDEHGDYCEGTHHGGRCYGPDSSCGYCGVGPALKHQPGCTRR